MFSNGQYQDLSDPAIYPEPGTQPYNTLNTLCGAYGYHRKPGQMRQALPHPPAPVKRAVIDGKEVKLVSSPSATDSMSQVKSAATQTFDGIAQNMAAMLTGSEQNWRSFTRSVLSMMTEILLKGCLTSASTAWGARMTSGCPMVSLPASFVSTAMAATIRRQGGHPAATGSSFLDR
ncbi:hypothetical protein [Xanthomonas phage vB_XooS_NR08]|nr:hypothetical protein [Xanthomonas phage vB_XooS_NR08]